MTRIYFIFMDDFFLVGMSGISVVFVVLPLVTICAYSQCLWCQGMSCNSKREMRDVVVDCRLPSDPPWRRGRPGSRGRSTGTPRVGTRRRSGGSDGSSEMWSQCSPGAWNVLYLEMRAEIFCSNMSRSVTATTEIKINMSTRDDINISKEAVHSLT